MCGDICDAQLPYRLRPLSRMLCRYAQQNAEVGGPTFPALAFPSFASQYSSTLFSRIFVSPVPAMAMSSLLSLLVAFRLGNKTGSGDIFRTHTHVSLGCCSDCEKGQVRDIAGLCNFTWVVAWSNVCHSNVQASVVYCLRPPEYIPS